MELLHYYKIYTKVLSKKITDAKKDHYNNLIMHSNNKIATTWKIIKTERGKTWPRDNATKMDVNGTTTCNPQIISDAINQYFLSVGNNNLISMTNTNYNTVITSPLDYLLETFLYGFSLEFNITT